ncbi:translation initiation factor IF-2 [bacterium]|nr:translation initiation factor IF-2 [bacterium]
MAEKKRIYELAKEIGKSSKELLTILRDLGYAVKNHMELATPEMINKVSKSLEIDKKEKEKKKPPSKAEPVDKEKTKKPKAERKPKEDIKKRKRRHKEILDSIAQDKVESTVKQTLARIEAGKKTKKYKKKGAHDVKESEEKVLRVPESFTVKELSEKLDVSPSEIIKKCLDLGQMVTINHRLDFETIALVSDEYGFRVKKMEEFFREEPLDDEEEEEGSETRPPIVTVMGHVDHGKTTLLDYIRKSNVVAGEKGGITQHIGAYVTETEYGRITFLDTPGHEAFTAMRARGSQATDIVVVVIGADDGIMPQTEEALDHAKAGGVPIIIAINKIDLPQANVPKVNQQLAQAGLLVEDLGGEILCTEISALKGEGVDHLLELISLQAELLELKCNPHRKAIGVTLEANLDRGMGPVATILITDGSLKIGDPFVVGVQYGKIRNMYNERGQQLNIALPSTPVRITGISGIPEAGDNFFVTESDQEARELSDTRLSLKRAETVTTVPKKISLENLKQHIENQKLDELKVVLKADFKGSLGAIKDVLAGIGTENLRVEVIHSGVGTISEADVLLAAASEAVIIAFHVEMDSRAEKVAKQENVEIRTYDVIYELKDEVIRALEGMLEPEIKEEYTGSAEIRQVFKITGAGKIAGCYVTDGTIRRRSKFKLRRDSEIITEGIITALKHFKQDVPEVKQGFECGINLGDFQDFNEGDVIEVYQITKTAKKLSG